MYTDLHAKQLSAAMQFFPDDASVGTRTASARSSSSSHLIPSLTAFPSKHRNNTLSVTMWLPCRTFPPHLSHHSRPARRLTPTLPAVWSVTATVSRWLKMAHRVHAPPVELISRQAKRRMIHIAVPPPLLAPNWKSSQVPKPYMATGGSAGRLGLPRHFISSGPLSAALHLVRCSRILWKPWQLALEDPEKKYIVYGGCRPWVPGRWCLAAPVTVPTYPYCQSSVDR